MALKFKYLNRKIKSLNKFYLQYIYAKNHCETKNKVLDAKYNEIATKEVVSRCKNLNDHQKKY